MKKRLAVFLGLLLFTCFSCNNGKNKEKPKTYDDGFVTKELSDDEIAVGSLTKGDKECYFVPEYIREHKVIQLGFISGWTFPGYGTFIRPDNCKTKKLICPSTIEKLFFNYLQWGGSDFVVTYCGKVQDLGVLDRNFHVTYYVPSNQYEEYLELFSCKDKEKLKKANVVYDLNYEKSEYYYVDFVEQNQKIENIPPRPSREGFIFEGWYFDKDFSKEFNFENEIVLLEEENELRLYAKWEQN